jgi:hypothetical protein
MKISASLVLFAAALLGHPALAQNFVVYSPPERDFRVLFPSNPVQAPERDGAVAFRAQQDAGEGAIEYVVRRLPATVQRTGSEEHDIQKLLVARLEGDGRVGRMRDEDLAAEWPRHVFEYRRSISVNRLVTAGSRSYHLEVLMPRNLMHRGMQTARDFFASFQASGVTVPGLMGIVQRLPSAGIRAESEVRRAVQALVGGAD